MGVPVIPAVIISLIVAAAFGFINALLINRFHTQGFITTLATASITQGLAYIITNLEVIRINNDAFTALGTKSVFGGYLPISVIIVAVFFVVYGLIMSKTKFGQSVYLVGGNPTASYLSGLNPKKVSYTLFLNSAITGGLAGLLLASRLKSVSTNGLSTSQFAGMTAAILGGISFGGGRGGLFGAALGLLVISAFNNGISSINISTYWQTIASGGLLLIALTTDFASMRQKEFSRRRAAARAKTARDAKTEGSAR
jgi:ribose/xylose/arabinose/galactoside ABC-type transport system permease subunit